MSTTVITRPGSAAQAQARGPLDVLAYRVGRLLVDWAERPRNHRGGDRRIDVVRLAQLEDRRADMRFAEPLGLHHWIR